MHAADLTAIAALGPAESTGPADAAGTASTGIDWPAYLLRHEATGCWVADHDGEVVGYAQSGAQEKFWTLSALEVATAWRGAGVGAALLDAALAGSQGCLYGGVAVPRGTPAARLVRRAGFGLHPTLVARGRVVRTTLPVVDGVRVGTSGDRDLADSVDRQVRGAAHGGHHDLLMRNLPMFVCDLFTGSGYCYVRRSGAPYLLAATNRKVAQRLLWTALAAGPEDADVRIEHLGAAQEWALDVAVAAGLGLESGGYLAIRHGRPPGTYLPSTRLF